MAFPSLKLIAGKNFVEDFVGERIVEAYWTANELLEQVSALDIKNLILNDLTREERIPKKFAEETAKTFQKTLYCTTPLLFLPCPLLQKELNEE